MHLNIDSSKKILNEESDEEMIDVDDEEDEAADDRLRIELTGHR